ncbi:hypothetical protein [Pseudoalteromonas phage vB_PtuP_Slicky01]|nr:hypothetical protein [Pseudoalteromonas phage vB_PtuP_Slicky01]
MGAISYTKSYIADPMPDMILGKDGNRTELDIFNLSLTEFVFIGLGDEHRVFKETEMLPLAPGEAYSSSAPPVTAVYLMANQPTHCLISYSTTAPAYVRGHLNG